MLIITILVLSSYTETYLLFLFYQQGIMRGVSFQITNHLLPKTIRMECWQKVHLQLCFQSIEKST